MSDVDMPEGSVWRKVRMSETLFRLLGADGVDWGQPDADGFYTPTVYLNEAGQIIQRMVNDEMRPDAPPPLME